GARGRGRRREARPRWGGTRAGPARAGRYPPAPRAGRSSGSRWAGASPAGERRPRARPRRRRRGRAPGPAGSAARQAYQTCVPRSRPAASRSVTPDGTVKTMPAAPAATASPAPPAPRLSAWPGILLSLGVAAASILLSRVLPGVSALIIAIVIGIVVANVTALPAALAPGLSIAAKKLLRAGIVLLGLEVVLGDLLGLGAPMLAVVVVVVTGGILGTLALGRALGVDRGLTLLVACGFSICGAAAVAAAAGVTDPDEEHEENTITAVALVVLCGTLMIAAVPA